MKRSPVYFLGISILVLIAIVGYRYQQYVVDHNFKLKVNTSCDPTTEACFQADCDPASDAECDTSPYKKVSILAKEAPACLEEHSCEAFTCDGKASCSISYCSESEVSDGEVCTTPKTQDVEVTATTTEGTP